MRSIIRIAFCGAVAIAFLGGCQTYSHRSVRTYEYNNEGKPQAQHLGSEYRMQSPGTMEAPGTMTNDPD